jgi:hypothetical protein
MAKAPREETSARPGTPPPPPALPPCKLLEEMRANPRKDWLIKDVETLCSQIGLEFKPPRRGSHYKVLSNHLEGMLTIPAHKPIKAPYIRHLVALADSHRKHTGE